MTMSEDQKKVGMMSMEELQNSEINIDIIKEALKQAEKRLQDFLETKNRLNQKLFILFNGYVPILIGLIIACFVIAQNNMESLLLFFLIPLSCFFAVSILFFVLAFQSAQHGSLGSSPDFWLHKDTISGDQKTLSKILSYLVYSYQQRIDVSYKSNLKKMTLQHLGIYLSITGIVISFIFFIFGCHHWNLCIQPLKGLFLGMVTVTILVDSVFCYRLAKHY
jgi:hypothetical protein